MPKWHPDHKAIDPMKVALCVENGKFRGKRVRLETTEVRIGRSRGCQIRVPDKSVSRHHCTICILENEVLISDQSSHGTFVNRRRLRGEWQLRDGDILQLGKNVFYISIEGEAVESSEDMVFD